MFLDDIAKQIDSLLHIWIIEFLELFDEDIQHGDSNFSFLGVMSIDILKFIFLHLLLCILIKRVDFLLNNVFDQ